MSDNFLSFFANNKNGFESVYYAVTAFSFLGAFFTYIVNSVREKRRREAENYERANERFLKYCELTMQYPGIDVDYDDFVAEKQLTKEEKVQQFAMFDIFASMAENAFLVYRGAASDQRRQQWEGWKDYIERYCRKKSFREYWFYDRQIRGQKEEYQFDKSFQSFMKKMMDQTSQGVQPPQPVRTRAAVAEAPS